jgi:hypothetical protein
VIPFSDLNSHLFAGCVQSAVRSNWHGAKPRYSDDGCMVMRPTKEPNEPWD